MTTTTGNRLAIEDFIEARLLAVAGVENVYRDEKIVQSIDAFVEAYNQNNQQYVQRWTLERVTSKPMTAENTNHRGGVAIRVEVRWEHTFKLELWIGIRDGLSTAYIQNLTDAVLTSFENQRSLGSFNSSGPLAHINSRRDWLNKVACRVHTFEVTVHEVVMGVAPE